MRVGRLRFAALRWMLPRLLLVLVAFGLTGMHTIGHAATVSRHVACPQVAVVAPVTVAVTCDCGGSCAGSFDECLAVLTGIGLVLLIAALVFVVRWPAGGMTADRSAVGEVRGPPPRWHIGLVLADLAVLRR